MYGGQYPDPNFNDRLIEPQALPWTYTFRIKTEPTGAPVSLDEFKAFTRLDGVDEEGLLEIFLKAATQAAEEYMGRAIMQQTIVMQMDYFPNITALLPAYLAISAAPIQLIRPPLVAVTAVRTLDEDGSTINDYDLSNYYWIAGVDARFVIRKGAVPPINTERYRGGFEIEYVCGYGASGDSIDQQRKAVPAPIKLGVMTWAAAMYAARGMARGGATEPPPDAMPMLSPYKFVRI